jgi:hypothetical protein
MSITERDQQTIAETLCHLSAVTNAPSSMGAQLDRLGEASEAKKHGPGWTTHAKPSVGKANDAEGIILRHARTYKLVSDITRLKSVDLEVPALVAVTLERKDTIGRMVIRIVREFQAALAAPSDAEIARADARASKIVRKPDETVQDVIDRQHATRQRALAEYRAPRGLEALVRRFDLASTAEAAELYADALLVLSMFVQSFNRKEAA